MVVKNAGTNPPVGGLAYLGGSDNTPAGTPRAVRGVSNRGEHSVKKIEYLLLGLGLVVGLAIAGCGDDDDDGGGGGVAMGGTPTGGTPTGGMPTGGMAMGMTTADVQTLFNGSCDGLGCHLGDDGVFSGLPPDLSSVEALIGTNYIAAGDRPGSLIFTRLTAPADPPRMPPDREGGALDPVVVEAVGAWIDGL